jgi:hypothetical protein
MQRLELLLLFGAAGVVVVASLLIAWQTSEARAAFEACFKASPPGANCPTSPSLNDLSLWGGFARLGGMLTPFALGLFLGVPVVAREIEGRTAGIAWTLAQSRLRWLVERVAPLLIMVVVVAAVVGLSGEVLARTNPFAEHRLDPGFADYGSRGVLLPVRAATVLLLAIAMGALVPRQLPALLLAGAATLGLFVALTIGIEAWMKAEARPIGMDQVEKSGARVFDVAYRENASGKVISMNDFYNRYGDIGTPDGGAPEGFTEVAIGIPGDQYGLWMLRESVVLGALALTGAGAAAVIVQRSGPSAVARGFREAAGPRPQ